MKRREREARIVERRPRRRVPEVPPDLAGWTIDKRRPSHWNAHRTAGTRSYFLKWFFHGRWARPALREWQAALALESLGIPSVVALAWGRHAGGSFVVLEGSPGLPLDAWREDGLGERDLWPLARQLAQLVGRLHGSGYCHKDLNVYHVLHHRGLLRIIDVGRVARYSRSRWVVKDLASLLDSARCEGLPRSAWRALFREYTRRGYAPEARRRLLRAVVAKAARYRRHNSRRPPPGGVHPGGSDPI